MYKLILKDGRLFGKSQKSGNEFPFDLPYVGYHDQIKGWVSIQVGDIFNADLHDGYLINIRK